MTVQRAAKASETEKIRYRSHLRAATLKEYLPVCTREFSQRETEFLHEDKGGSSFRIGIEKGGHAGFWYDAECTDCDDGCIIEGEILYGSKKQAENEMLLFKIGFWLTAAVLFVIFCVPILVLFLVERSKGRKRKQSKEESLDLFLCEYVHCEKIADA